MSTPPSVRTRCAYVAALVLALVFDGASTATAGRRQERVRCCRTRAKGATKCRVKLPTTCASKGGVDLGPGTCHPNPCAAATTSTTTGATTTTTVPGHVQVLIEPLAAPASCGGPGYGTPASPPFSGEVDDGSGTKLADLQLACVYAGGAAAGQPGGGTPITNRAYGGGRMLIDGEPGNGTLVIFSASDEPGPLGCTRGAGPTRHCLGASLTGSECTTDADCDGSPGTCQPDARCYTTEPIDYSATGISGFTVCLVNVVESDVTGTVDVATGEASYTLPLATRVYLSQCPQCTDGQCSTGQNVGDACVTTEGGGTSVGCLPSDRVYFGVIVPTLASTTGMSTMTSDATGVFCAGQPYPGAFGLAAARTIGEQGSAAGDLRDFAPHEYTGAITGCVTPSSNTVINQSGGLPFPLAAATRATMQLR